MGWLSLLRIRHHNSGYFSSFFCISEGICAVAVFPMRSCMQAYPFSRRRKCFHPSLSREVDRHVRILGDFFVSADLWMDELAWVFEAPLYRDRRGSPAKKAVPVGARTSGHRSGSEAGQDRTFCGCKAFFAPHFRDGEQNTWRLTRMI